MIMTLQQIAEHCQQGDRDAFALLYSASRQRLRSLCLRYVNNESVADDLLHDAYILIFTRIGDLKDTARAEAWMQRVVRNVALVYLRQQKQRRQLPLESAADASVAATTTLEYDDLLAAVSALPDGYRQVFRLSVLEGMSHKQIGALLQIEPHSSSSQLSHAKALLRRWLAPLLLLLAVVLPLTLNNVPERVGEEHHQQPAPETIFDERNGRAEGNTVGEVGTGLVSVRNRHVRADGHKVRSNLGSATYLCKEPQEGSSPTSPEGGRPPLTPPSPLPLGQRPLARQEPPPGGDSCSGGLRSHPLQLEGAGGGRAGVGSHVQRSPWSLSLAYSGAGGGRWDGRLPYGDDATSITTFDSISHHHPPLSVGVTLGFSLNDRWQLTAGLSYQRLTSEMLSGNSLVSLHERQLVRQLGVPVGASWRVAVGGRWQVYASASATLLLPLRSWLSSHYVVADGSSAEPAERRLHMGMQWAVGVGLGLSYEVAPHASFFVEPSVQHYFRGGDNVSTWNTGHPLVLSLPIGLRIGF